MLTYQPQKKLGQNFLNDESTSKLIVNSLNINKGDRLLEIGGGYGALSKIILQSAKFNEYFIFELDENLASELVSITKDIDNVHILNEDFLQSDLSAYSDYKVIGAIPYYITSPIIHKLLGASNRPTEFVIMIQKEVADKILCEAPRSNYWTNIRLGYKVSKVSDVDRTSFTPEPNVDSSILHFQLDLEQDNIISKFDFIKWSKFLHHTYKTPRKMLNKRFEKEKLESINIAPTDRPQNLTPEDLLKLYDMVYDTQ